MAARSIATLSLTFGLVSIPVKVYSATESSTAVRFKLMSSGGGRLRQQYVSEEPARTAQPAVEEAGFHPPPSARSSARSSQQQGTSRVIELDAMRRVAPNEASPVALPPEPEVVDRSEMVKGYEFEKGRFVLFTADELEALAEASRQTIDIVSFIPSGAVDPIYYDKAYFLAPDKRGAKPYSLLHRAMQDTGRCALAKWAWRSKEYVVQIRPGRGGLVLQQLLYADEVRSITDLGIDLVAVGEGELQLATRLIEQIAAPSYDPALFVDEEKARILAAVEKKIQGRKIVAPSHAASAVGTNVVDLMGALRASLESTPKPRERKPVRRAGKPAVAAKSAKGKTTRP
jgi:DNA end-binding protein Ku